MQALLLTVATVLFAGFLNLRAYFACRRRAGRRGGSGGGGDASDDGSGASANGGLADAVQTIAFFHPYANSGGGGERVLWLAVKALLQSPRGRGVRIVIFTGDTDSAEAIFARTRERFGVDFDSDDGARRRRPTFVRLRRRAWIEAARWPRFTMVGQSVGSMLLAVEAVLAFTPDVFVDTTGFAFSFPVAWLLAGCRVAAYVHYPTISTDMLRSVVAKRPSYNNDASISASGWRTRAKLLYYHAFALLYKLVGRCCHVVMANSSWTAGHIRSLWGKADIVYPPCDVSTFAAFPLGGRRRVVVSVSQYRPEKDQQLQIRALAELHRRFPAECADVSLVLIGSCRHADDHEIADNLEALARELGVHGDDGGGAGSGGGGGVEDGGGGLGRGTVSVLRNVPYEDLKGWLARATAGIHTMWNEHFGIGVVEMQAAGAVTVAHDSAGPQMDIIVPAARGGDCLDADTEATGLLASSVDDYASALATVFTAEPEVIRRIQKNGRAACERFSEDVFLRGFIQAMEPLLPR